MCFSGRVRSPRHPSGPEFPPTSLPEVPPVQRPPRGTALRRLQARSPESQPVLCADQYTNPKREMFSSKHRVTRPHPRPGPSRLVAEIGTAVRKSPDGSSQNGTSSLHTAAGISDFRTAERTCATTGADLCTGLCPKSEARAQVRPTVRSKSDAGTERGTTFCFESTAGTEMRSTLCAKSDASTQSCTLLRMIPVASTQSCPTFRSIAFVSEQRRPAVGSKYSHFLTSLPVPEPGSWQPTPLRHAAIRLRELT